MPTLGDSQNMPRMNDILSMYNLLLSTNLGIWVWEPKTETLFFNARYMDMLGYRHDAFPLHISTWENLIHPDDREQTVAVQRALLADPSRGETFESRFRFLTSSGNYMWILGKGFVLGRDDKGQALRVAGMHIDLESLNDTMEEVAVAHDRMSFALEAARDGLWDWNAATDYVYFSPRYISMLGYTPEEFPPRLDSWSRRVHPDDLDITVNRQLAHVNNPCLGDEFECVYRFLTADNSYKWILGRGKITRRDEQGKAIRVVGLHTDITELRTAQETLSQLLNLDALTRLHSRFFFDAELARLEDEDLPISIIFGDVDGLKLLNDHLGHATGDRLLSTAASLLRQSVGRNTVVTRIGGDEFAILLRGCPAYTAEALITRINEHMVAHNAKPNALPIYMSLGSMSTETPMPPHKLLALADRDMLRHKAEHHAERLQSIREWIARQTGGPVSDFDTRLN